MTIGINMNLLFSYCMMRNILSKLSSFTTRFRNEKFNYESFLIIDSITELELEPGLDSFKLLLIQIIELSVYNAELNQAMIGRCHAI